MEDLKIYIHQYTFPSSPTIPLNETSWIMLVGDDEMNVKIASIALLAILLLPISGGFIGYAMGVGDRYIEAVERFIKYHLDLAEEYGIELSDEQLVRVDRALSYIELAKNESNRFRAYEYALKASIEFAPVYLFIVSNIDIEDRFDKSLYIELINNRKRVIIQMNRTIERFQDTLIICREVNIEVDAGRGSMNVYREICIELDINRFRGLIEGAMDKLSYIEENIDRMSMDEIREMLSQVDDSIALMMKELNEGVGRRWRSAGLVHGMSIASKRILESIVYSINRSIDFIEDGESQRALSILVGLEHRLDAYINILNKTLAYAERVDESQGLIDRIKELYNVVSSVRDLISLAIDSLESGDDATALNYLEQALTILQTYLSDYGEGLPISMDVIMRLIDESTRIRDRVRMHIQRFMEGNLRGITRMIDNIERQINQLVNRYENGMLPKQVFINMLNNLKDMLIEIRDMIEDRGGMYQDILDRVEQLIDYIDQLLDKYS